jgi:hypothetical protein
MSIIFHIMKEEHDRLRQAEKAYSKSVKAQVQGAPRIKHIGSRDYLYLERRDGRKVVDHYIGPADSAKAHKVLESVKKRRQDMQALRRVRRDLKEVRRVLRGKREV